MVVYAPGTQEKDLTKICMSLQQNAQANTTNAANAATNTAAITTNTASIATNTASIAALQPAAKASFCAVLTSNMTGVASATNTKVTATTEEWDQGSYYDAANSKWIPPAGRVRFSASVYFSAGAVDQAQYQALLYKNGVQERVFCTSLGSGTTGVAPGGSVSSTSNGTDYFELYAYGGGAGTKTILAAAAITYFQGEMF